MPFYRLVLFVSIAIKHTSACAWSILHRVSVKIVRTILDILVASFDDHDNGNVHHNDNNYNPESGESLVRGYDNQVWEAPGKFG